MSTNHTEHYGLSQWEPDDAVLRKDFNADNLAIDQALHAETTARTSAVSSISAALAKCGNCTIWTTTYRGTGTYGEAHPTSVTFPKKPLAALIVSTSGKPSWMTPMDGLFLNNESNALIYLKWSGSKATWYSDSHSGAQFNVENNTYYVVALMAADT